MHINKNCCFIDTNNFKDFLKLLKLNKEMNLDCYKWWTMKNTNSSCKGEETIEDDVRRDPVFRDVTLF